MQHLMIAHENSSMHQSENLVQEEFDRFRSLHKNDARALELVAIELELSLEDCATVIGREDLIEHLGTPWRIEFPTVGPPALRRG